MVPGDGVTIVGSYIVAVGSGGTVGILLVDVGAGEVDGSGVYPDGSGVYPDGSGETIVPGDALGVGETTGDD